MANESAKMTMWRGAIEKEQAAARAHRAAWDFLCVHDDEAGKLRRGEKRVPIKYYKDGATVVMKRLPALPMEQAQHSDSTGGLEDNPNASYMLSHTQQMETIRAAADPFTRTTYQTYGSRLPIEMFGVRDHARIATSITRWEKRDDV